MIYNKELFLKFNAFCTVNQEVILFSPYIKLEALRKINASNSIKQIIVSWSIEDLIKGVSDIELYDYCKKQGITLYRNPRIHLKVLWNGDQNIILGSANITNRGLALIEKYNFELAAGLEKVDLNTQVYLRRIINESIVVDDDLFSRIKRSVEEQREKLVVFKDIESSKVNFKNDFLLSALPQSFDPEVFLNTCLDWQDSLEIDKQCAVLDLVTYQIDLDNCSRKEFLELLETRFNAHPFIIKFKDFISTSSRRSSNYGGCVRWIQNNCTNVPIPRSYEMKEDSIVNILYRWICFFDDRFSVSVPGNRSEVIFFDSEV
ncbi:phospholipase D-like domain-containing protein [Myroides sp. LJL115]